MKKQVILALLTTYSCVYGVEIKSINFEGLVQLSPTVATQIAGLGIGEELTPQKSDRAIKKLFEQNYFNDIYIDNKDGHITFIVKERPSIAKLDIEGVVTNDKKIIESLIGIKQGQIYNTFSMEKAKERIRQFYEVKGFFDTVVVVDTKPIAEGSSGLHVTMKVNRGEKIIIQNVNLVGAKELDYSDIEPAVANKQKEILGWMWGFNDGGAKIFELANDPAKILDEYFKKSYLDATVSTPYFNAFMDNYTAELTYYITEGERYKISDITLEIPDFVGVNADEIKDDFKLEVGDTMNSQKLRFDTKKIEDAVANKGYAYVKVIPQTDKNQDNHTVAIHYKVIPGNQVYIRNVNIAGNEKTADKVIRRELYLTEGNLYNRQDMLDSRNALKRTSYFDEAQIKEERVNDNQVDLLVDVKEAPTGSITGGIGYGSSDGLLLSASLSDTNVFGTGLKGVIGIDKSDDELSGRIGLTNPRLFDSRYSLSGMVYANNYDWDTYEEDAYGFTTAIGRQLGRYTNVSLAYVIEQSDIKKLSDSLIRTGYKTGKNLKSAFIPSISFDNTDDYYLPRSGIIASTSLEMAGAGGDSEFFKNRTKFNVYQGLADYIGYDLILRYKSEFQKAWDNGYLPINERIYLGGMRSIRGFDSRSVSPKNTYGDEIGGEISFNNSVELSFPLIDRIKMRGLVFFDYGMIGEGNNIDQIKRYSTGAGIEWTTPIGPLQLIFTKPLNDEAGDDTNTFEFMIGSRF
ncbi:outer membrane protein assembly complex, YaeT protein [Campylobacter sputorum subsp. bubulus]|uniref:outer membrane protein assembly factor BamA n=1 Tax=Campylobacter sputorum TaxID=206 RepID=UPI000E14C972|nr:outer membrane protein assembly factor BamA [Campylobacter sputorum]SUX09498.1 outer membrane protein assembly complex, YaeT protein [Campylobacter sputorum subsp. bubulus]